MPFSADGRDARLHPARPVDRARVDADDPQPAPLVEAQGAQVVVGGDQPDPARTRRPGPRSPRRPAARAHAVPLSAAAMLTTSRASPPTRQEARPRVAVGTQATRAGSVRRSIASSCATTIGAAPGAPMELVQRLPVVAAEGLADLPAGRGKHRVRLAHMRLCIFTEPQLGASYADQVKAARTTEAAGFDGYFRSDHYLTMGGDGLPGPTDSWVTLAGLALETSTIRLGTLVTSATFRHPGPAGHQRGAGRRDERRPDRARPRSGLVRGRTPGLRDPVPAGPRAFRPPDRAARDHHVAVGGAGQGSGSTIPASTTGASTRPGSRSRCSRRARRSSWAVPGRSARRRWPRSFADEFNVPFRSAAEAARIYRRRRRRLRAGGPHRPAGQVGGRDHREWTDRRRGAGPLGPATSSTPTPATAR